MRTRLRTWLLMLTLVLVAPAGADPAEIARLRGQFEQAAAQAASDAQQAAAAEAFARWRAAAEQAAASEEERAFALADVHAAFGRVVLTGWAARELDEFDISGGRRGDVPRLRRLLLLADEHLLSAARSLEPLNDRLAQGGRAIEDRLLVLGLFDRIGPLSGEIRFHRGWTLWRLAGSDAPTAADRGDRLQTAGRNFLLLLEAQPAGDAGARCRLGLALVQTALKDPEAEASFAAALEAAQDPALRAQVRCRLAAARLDAGQFDAARTAVEPLTRLDPARLPPDDAGLRFYVSWAGLLEADSWLRESLQLAASAPGLAAERREAALTRFLRLAGRGGPWPELVRLYIGPHLDLSRPPAELSPAELLLAARELRDRGDTAAALERLRSVAASPVASIEVRGDALLELAAALVEQGDASALAEAADACDELLKRAAEHPRASAAATLLFQLRARIAEQSKAPDDYRRLAAALGLLLERFPQHEQRLDAAWWRPVALQAAGDLAAAAIAYAAVPLESPHSEEAQWRSINCRRMAWENAQRSAPGPLNEAQLAQLVRAYKDYAAAAVQRSAALPDGGPELRARAAEAQLLAAELEAAPGVDRYSAALETLQGFEAGDTDPVRAARAAGVRVRCLLALRRPESATEEVRRLAGLASASAESERAALAVLAPLLAELERLERDGPPRASLDFSEAVRPLVEQLARAEAIRTAGPRQLQAVEYGLALLRLYTGDLAGARQLAERLVAADPQSGAFRRLLALALTRELQVEPDAADLSAGEASAGGEPAASALPAWRSGLDPDAIRAARAAWEQLLAEPSLRQTAPQRYWEARTLQLALLQLEGRQEEVNAAIRQERVWFPDLGGEPWRTRITALEK